MSKIQQIISESIGEDIQRDTGVIEIHYTCRHSDKYNYSCGDCIEKMFNTLKADLRSKLPQIEKQIIDHIQSLKLTSSNQDAEVYLDLAKTLIIKNLTS